MKAIVLKPIIWNTNFYFRPSGVPCFSGFVKDYGYGHEEWNNNQDRCWRGFKIFHTEATDRLLKFSETGELGIIMTTTYGGSQHAVGIATNVFHNTEEDMDLITDELNIFENWKEVWNVPLVKEKFRNNKENFILHWKENYRWIRWKCPLDNFYWF